MKRISKRTVWSENEINQLKENGVVPKRTNNSIREKKNRLGLRSRRKSRPKWTKNNLEELKRLREKGLSARNIYNMGTFACSMNAIQKQMCRLGIVKKNNIFKFPINIRQKFSNFLLNNWEGKIPDDLVEIWNKENAKYPTNKRKVISYLIKLKIKIPYGEVQRIKNVRKKIEIIHSSVDTSSNTLEKIRLERAKMMRKRIERGRDIWTGICSEITEENEMD
jgi:hypothetical protein